MTSVTTAKPSSKVVSPFGYPGDKVTAYEVISVTRYESGTRRASHGRLDPASNRMTFTRLSNPAEEYECPHAVAHDLARAAEERLDDLHSQQTIW